MARSLNPGQEARRKYVIALAKENGHDLRWPHETYADCTQCHAGADIGGARETKTHLVGLDQLCPWYEKLGASKFV